MWVVPVSAMPVSADLRPVGGAVGAKVGAAAAAYDLSRGCVEVEAWVGEVVGVWVGLRLTCDE